MKRTVLLYGLLGAALIVVLRLVEYRFLVIEHSLEIYGGIVALIFAALGIWLGLRLTARSQTRAELSPSAARGAADPATIEKYGVTPRELEILTLIAQGHSNREIAEKL